MNIEAGEYSQSAEQGVINSLVGDTGRFLDVGTYNAKIFSNTRKLYERGWAGVMVEPSPANFAGLEKEYGTEERIRLIQATVAPEAGEIDFFDSGGDAISSTDEAHAKRWEAGYDCKFEKIKVKAITWSDLFDMVDPAFGFVNIVTESTNLELLQTFPFGICNPMCMCIEHDNHVAEMMTVLGPYGFRVVYQSGENIVVYRGE